MRRRGRVGPGTLALCALLGACAIPSGGRGPDTLEEAARAAPEGPKRASIHLVEQSTDALVRRDLELARGLAERALRLDGRNPYAYYALARVSIAAREPERATRDIEQAEALLSPSNQRWQGKLLRLRAEISWLEHDTEQARALRARADRLDPGGGMPGSPEPHVLESPR